MTVKATPTRNQARLIALALGLGVVVMLLGTAAGQERLGERDGSIPLVWWPVIALAAALVIVVLVLLGLLHLTPIVLALVGTVVGLRWLARRRPRPDRALDILRERYARGEVSKDEFETRRRDLEG